MKKQSFIALLMLFGSVFASLAYGHEDFRTVGVIENLILKDGELNNIQVRDQNGASVQLWISGATRISRDNQVAGKSDLQVGTTVVVDSYGDEYNFSEALTVRIVPTIPSSE